MLNLIGHEGSGLVALELIVDGGFEDRSIGAAHQQQGWGFVGALAFQALVYIEGSDTALGLLFAVDVEGIQFFFDFFAA